MPTKKSQKMRSAIRSAMKKGGRLTEKDVKLLKKKMPKIKKKKK